MAGHWSKDMYSIWWRDAGTLRARVSFAPEKDSLLRRLAKIQHDDMDAALYAPNGDRLSLNLDAVKPVEAPKKKAKKKKGKKAPKPVAA